MVWTGPAPPGSWRSLPRTWSTTYTLRCRYGPGCSRCPSASVDLWSANTRRVQGLAHLYPTGDRMGCWRAARTGGRAAAETPARWPHRAIPHARRHCSSVSPSSLRTDRPPRRHHHHPAAWSAVQRASKPDRMHQHRHGSDTEGTAANAPGCANPVLPAAGIAGYRIPTPDHLLSYQSVCLVS